MATVPVSMNVVAPLMTPLSISKRLQMIVGISPRKRLASTQAPTCIRTAAANSRGVEPDVCRDLVYAPHSLCIRRQFSLAVWETFAPSIRGARPTSLMFHLMPERVEPSTALGARAAR